MHAAAQCAGAFSVDDADGENIPFLALRKVFRNENANVRRSEGVKIQLTCDGDLNG